MPTSCCLINVVLLNLAKGVFGSGGRSLVGAVNASRVRRISDQKPEANKLRQKFGIVPAVSFFFAGYFVAGVGWWNMHTRCRSGRDFALWSFFIVIGILISLWGGWHWLIVGGIF